MTASKPLFLRSKIDKGKAFFECSSTTYTPPSAGEDRGICTPDTPLHRGLSAVEHKIPALKIQRVHFVQAGIDIERFASAVNCDKNAVSCGFLLIVRCG